MTETCPSCGQQGIRRLRSHLSRNAFCARAFYSPEDSNGETEAGPSIYPPIPAVINTSHASPQLPDNARGTSERTNSYRSRLRTRETPLNYAESARKRGCTSDPDDGFPTPDEDLGDYISTFFDTDDQPEADPPLMLILVLQGYILARKISKTCLNWLWILGHLYMADP
jgi:hypothetical protein